jgi:formate dehydrogenase subunit delta
VSGDDKLIRMANQIASFFRSYPDDEAMTGIAKHLESFWTPKMRRTFATQIAEGVPGIDPLVVRALAADSPGEDPARKENAGPDEVGQMASDAG